jgi:putative ABC transport system permease protein
MSDMTLVARTAGDPHSFLAALTAVVHEQDARLPVYRIATMQDAMLERLGPWRAASSLLGAFGTLALLLAALGLYAVMAFAVTQRTREIGVRMALGAGHRDVLAMFVGEGVRLAGIGIGIGLVASFALTRVISSFLYGVNATDWPTFLLGAVILAAVAVLASYLPARRAARVDPMVALRYE